MKIKKAKLLQIIKEELARVDEAAASRREQEDALFNRWVKGDEQAYNELYGKIYPEIIKFLMSKRFSNLLTTDAEDIAQEVFTNLHANPGLFGGRAALSTFLKGNAFNKARDKFRRVVKTGEGPTKTGDTRAQIDMATTKGDIGLEQLPSGSRFPAADRVAHAKDLFSKLEAKDPYAAKIFKMSMTYDQGEIAEIEGMSQGAISKQYSKAIAQLRAMDKMQESMQQDRTWDSDPTDTDRDMTPEDELIYLNDIYSDVYKEVHNMRPGSRPPFRTPEDAMKAIDDLYAYQEAEERSEAEDARVAAEEEVEQAEFDALMAPGVDLDYELPKQGGMAGTATRPTPDSARRRGSMFPRRPDDRYKLDRLEEMVEAIVKEALSI